MMNKLDVFDIVASGALVSGAGIGTGIGIIIGAFVFTREVSLWPVILGVVVGILGYKLGIHVAVQLADRAMRENNE
jgi:hypothetical protein